MTVNVSSVQLRSAEFVATVAGALERGGLSADRLVLGLLTETVLMTDFNRTAGRLREAAGARRADRDRRFRDGVTRRCSTSRRCRWTRSRSRAVIDTLDSGGGALARAIVDLGRSFGLTVVAEGIETEAQRDALRALGCTRGQGYLFARPLTAEALLTAV